MVIGSLKSARAEAEAHLLDEAKLRMQGHRLRKALSKRLGACASLFQIMDTDGNGQITRAEFSEAVSALGVKGVCASVIDELFDEFDMDGSGDISYGEFVTHSLREKLRSSTTRVMDCFRSFDTDGNGVVDKHEFRRAISAMFPDESFDPFLLDTVFDGMDLDGSGSLSFDEMHRQLRSGYGHGKSLDPALADGAAGKIVLKAKTKHALRGARSAQALPDGPHVT